MDVKELPGRGLGVVATQRLETGQVILNELPIMLYPQASAVPDVCSFCLRWLAAPGITPVQCPTCTLARFCSPTCAAAAAADPASHCSLVCRALSACNMAGLSDEDQSTLHYLFRAISLLLSAINGDNSAASRSSQITALAGRPSTLPGSDSDLLHARELHGRIQHALTTIGADPSPISLDIIVSFLDRDLINSYGISAPIDPESDIESERKLRGSALYASASRLNHECLPNAARFDAFDAPQPPDAQPGANTALQLRMLHALPAGEEVTQSYFPLTWSFTARQERCRDQYGFVCTCPRCKEEASWPLEARGGSSIEEASDGAEDALAAAVLEGGPTGGDVADAGYIHVFLFKYVCPREGCGGTMAPMPEDPQLMRCNVCERIRTEAEFLAELEASG